jgi:hypothetical protein
MLSSLVLAVAITVPPYPGATPFCSDHVVGAPSGGQAGLEIQWTAYHSAATPETVVAWYQRQLAEGLHRREGPQDVWRIPAVTPETVLSVTTVADAPPPVASCTTRPPATARTVILISTMSRPGAAAPPGQAQAQAKAFRQSFPAAGITKVVLRAEHADTATVTTVEGASTIELSGVPIGGAKGYMTSDPKWRETPPEKWGLKFVSERRGDVLIVSTFNEMRYIHHYYAFESVAVRVPSGVEVVREKRELNGDGAPDLH